jgi:alpha/beta superfamily hydrolase
MSELPPRRSAAPRARANSLATLSTSRRCALALGALAFTCAVADVRASAAQGTALGPTPQSIPVTPQPVVPSSVPSASASASKPPHGARATPRPRVARKPAAASALSAPKRFSYATPSLAPPNGTYVYAIARDGTDQGKSTVVVFRRAPSSTIEVDESIAVGQFHAHLIGGYAYDSLLPNLAVATYQAPFPPSVPLGRESRFRPHIAEAEQTTVRYAFDTPHSAFASIDGVQGTLAWPLPQPDLRSPLTGLAPETTPSPDASPETQYARTHEGAFSLDGPVMSEWLMLPAWLRKSGATALTPVGAAFPEYVANVRVARIALPAKSKKTPKSAIAKRVGDFATVWFDPQTQIVYEVRLDTLNLDIRLLSYSKVTTTAPFEPAPTPAPTPEPDRTALSVSVEGATLAGVVQMPLGAKRPLPAVVLVAPPVGEALPTRSYGGSEAHSLFVSLANALLKRGYAVARFDARGIGASGGSYADLTWETSVSDAAAVVREVQGIDGIDAGRVFVAGYHAGADIAFSVASDPDDKIAGVVALGPTVVSYREALHRQFVNAQTKPEDRAAAERAFEHELKRLGRAVAASGVAAGAVGIEPDPTNGGVWYKSAIAHDPVALAARSVVPAFVLHGVSFDPARTPDDVRTYDDRLRANDSLATAVVASDLSEKFGGRYDADSPENTEAIFPYAFDASTAGTIADWMDGIRAGMRSTRGNGTFSSSTPRANPTPPKPPPLPSGSHASSAQGQPVKRKPIDDVQPGQVGLPSTMQAPLQPPSPSPTPSPAPTPKPTSAPATAPPTLSPPAPHAS